MVESDPDVRLMLALKENDSEEALRNLYEKYRRPICKFFYCNTFDATLAEDCAQEVFLRLWRNRKRYEPTGKFSNYIYQIAKNYWINERAKRIRRPAQFSIDVTNPSREDELFRDQIATGAPGPSENLVHRETDLQMARAIQSLPEKLRMVFVMSQVQDHKYREIGEILGIPEGTVKSRFSRALRIVRERLRSYFKEETGKERNVSSSDPIVDDDDQSP